MGKISVRLASPMISLPAWAQLSIITATVLLSPVLAFLMALAVEIVIGVLVDAGPLTLITLVPVGGFIGWSVLRKRRLRPQDGTQNST
jgi:hypothetical protein